MILITQLYKTNSARYNELLKSLKQNVQNKYIKEIILLNEEKLDLQEVNSSKIKQIIINKRLTYKLAFDYSENNIKHGEIVILVNSDIWFNNTIKQLNSYDMTTLVIALTRYDCLKKKEFHKMFKQFNEYKLLNRPDSQDCWIFQNPIKLQHDYNFKLGIPSCDNRIAWIIKNSKKK